MLHALALAHHAMQIGGESIDLGGFRQYVHRRQRDRQVELGFEVDPRRLSGRVAEILRSAREVVVELGIGEGFTSDQLTLFGDRDRELDRAGGVRVERFALDVDGAPVLSMSATLGGLVFLDRLDHAHPVFRDVFRGLLMLGTTTQEIGGRISPRSARCRTRSSLASRPRAAAFSQGSKRNPRAETQRARPACCR